MREFSKNLNKINCGHMAMKPPPNVEAAARKAARDGASKRDRALDFAKHGVPKPKMRPVPVEDDDDDEPIGSARDRHEQAAGYGDGGAIDGGGGAAPSLLEDLEMRHENQRAQVDAIRREMGF